MLALLASFCCSLPAIAADFVVKDTSITDGYYRIHVLTPKSYGTDYGDSIMGVLTSEKSEAPDFTGAKAFYAKSNTKYGSGDNWNFVWRVINHSDGTFTLKNCGPQTERYAYPRVVTGQASFIYGWNKEVGRFHARTADKGTTKATGNGSVPDFNRQDYVPADRPGYVFLISTDQNARMRVGGDDRLKCNSKDDVYRASWKFVPVDLTGKEGWMQLNEALQDAKGPKYAMGEDPGYVTNQEALNAINDAIDKGTNVYNAEAGTYTDAEFAAEAQKIRAAIAEVEKYKVQLEDGYYVLHTYGAPGDVICPVSKYTNAKSIKNCGYNWIPASLWLGWYYPDNTDAATTSYEYIWHLKKASDSTFVFKSCAESGYCGDSTYFNPVVFGQNYTQSYMVGTPHTDVFCENIDLNVYRFTMRNSTRAMSEGSDLYITGNDGTRMTWSRWGVVKVPASRITDKFKLNEAITDAGGILVDWVEGTDPGFTKGEVLEPLKTALAFARKIYTDGGDYASATTALRSAYNTTMEQLKDTAACVVPVTEGYYRIVCSNPRFAYLQGGAVATVYGGSDAILRWDVNYDTTDPSKLFKITKSATEGCWNAMCVGTNSYIQGTAEAPLKVSMGSEPSDIVISQDVVTRNNTNGFIRFKTAGEWNICSALNKSDLFNLIRNNECKSTGDMVYEGSGDENAIRFFLRQETNNKTIASLVEAGAQSARNIAMNLALVDADNALNPTLNYTFNEADSLIKTAGYASGSTTYDRTLNQFDCNNQQIGDGSYANLIDGRNAYWFHTQYNKNPGNVYPSKPTYLQVNFLDKPQQNFCFLWGLRGSSDYRYGANIDGMPTTYGVTDFGQIQRPLYFIITASNDTVNGPWTEVKQINDLCTDANFRTYYSPIIQADQAYQFYRITVPEQISHSAFNNVEYFTCGRFQAYPATVDEANSPAVYDANVKAAVDIVKDLVNTGKAQLAAGTSTQVTLDALAEATAKLKEVNIDTMGVKLRLLQAQILADSSYVCDNEDEAQFGDVSTDQKATFEAAIAAAQKTIQPATHPTQASLVEAYNALDKAYWTLNSERKTFELNKWYYLQSAEKFGYHGKSYAWRGGHYYYASGANVQNAIQPDTVAYRGHEIRWGHYVDFDGQLDGQTYPKAISGHKPGTYDNGHMDNEENPFAMWRIVQLEDSVYAVQNRATGLYIGRNQDADWYVAQATEPLKFSINIVGRNEFEIINKDSVNGSHYSSVANAKSDAKSILYGAPLHQQGNNFRAVWWGTGTERGYDTGSAMTFVPVDADNVLELTFPAKNNSYEVKSYPFDINAEIYADIDNIGVYKLKKITTNVVDSTFSAELTKINLSKETLPAGTPFILKTGNAGDVTATKDSVTLYIPLNDGNFSLANKTVNGLTASVTGDSLRMKPGMGIFVDGVLNVTDSTSVFVKGQTGYIDAAATKDAGGSADVTINGKGVLNAIDKVIINTRRGNSNIYSVDGKLIRRSSTDTKGLSKGVYIVNGEKVVVE